MLCRPSAAAFAPTPVELSQHAPLAFQHLTRALPTLFGHRLTQYHNHSSADFPLMAAADVAGAQCGVVVPEVPDTSVTYDGAMTATKDLIMTKLTTNIVEDVPPGDISPADLPLRMLAENQVSVKWFIDIVPNVDPSLLNKVAVTQEYIAGRFADLPPPFSLRRDQGVGYTLQIAVAPQNDGNLCVVKHVMLSDKVKWSLAVGLCRGDPTMITWRGSVWTCRKAFHYMFQLLGGTCATGGRPARCLRAARPPQCSL